MQTLKMVVLKDDLTWIKNKIDGSAVTLLKETNYEGDWAEIEILCDDPGVLFKAGEYKGWVIGFKEGISHVKSADERTIQMIDFVSTMADIIDLYALKYGKEDGIYPADFLEMWGNAKHKLVEVLNKDIIPE